MNREKLKNPHFNLEFFSICNLSNKVSFTEIFLTKLARFMPSKFYNSSIIAKVVLPVSFHTNFAGFLPSSLQIKG